MAATRIDRWVVAKIDNGGIWFLGARLSPKKGDEPRRQEWFWTLDRAMALVYPTYEDADRRAEKYNHEGGTKAAGVWGWVG